jgi:hypothetical protein
MGLKWLRLQWKESVTSGRRCEPNQRKLSNANSQQLTHPAFQNRSALAEALFGSAVLVTV